MAPSDPQPWIERLPLSRTVRLVLLSVLLGVLGTFGALAFITLLDAATELFLVDLAGYQPPTPRFEGNQPGGVVGPYGTWLLPVATTLGGLLAGLWVHALTPESEGHGTDSAIRAFHRFGGAQRWRVPFVKAVAAALTIGSGGAGGREGATSQLSAGIGSILAGFLKLPVAERRILVLAGIAAGLSAAFKAPLGAALFAVEVLYSGIDFESEALVYAVIAASVAYAVAGFFIGWTPLLDVPAGLALQQGSDLLWFGLLGVLAGATGAVLTTVFHGIGAGFARIAVHRAIKPALGGLLLGLMAVVLPEVLGSGYGFMQRALDGAIEPARLWVLLLAKIVALGLTLGSGGTGGVFAACLYVGCFLGVGMSQVLTDLLPHASLPHPAALGVVGLAAVFAGAGRVPLASLVLTAEITGGHGLIVPAMLAVSLAVLLHASLGRRLKLSHPLLFGSQVPTRAESPTHQAETIQAALHWLRGDVKALPASAQWPELDHLLQLGRPMPVGHGGEVLTAQRVPAESPFVGQKVRDLGLPDDVLVVSVLREERHLPGRGHVQLQAGDVLLVLARPEAISGLAGRLEPVVPAGPRDSQVV